MASYKQRCKRCHKNMVLVTSGRQFPICYSCQKEDLNKEITDPEMKKMFDIPEELYEKSSFLRDIKISYLKFENLTERQIEAFKSTVEKMKEKKDEPPKPPPEPSEDVF